MLAWSTAKYRQYYIAFSPSTHIIPSVVMLSLPLFPPPPDPIRTHFRPRAESPPPPPTTQPNHQQLHRQQQRRDEERKVHNTRSPLALLAADEAAIAQRKAAIRNFGAYWIRPPGVGKTLQAMNEEAIEAAEQEELMRQEQGLRDMQAQQQAEELREQAAETAEQGEGGGEGEEERNLDDEIPDADAQDASAVEAPDVTFNEDSMVEGSHLVEDEVVDEEHYAEMEEAELTGAAQEEEDMGMDNDLDLDNSVPEAGSYQHTDTELEDSSSESGLDDSFAQQSARRSTRSAGRLSQPALGAGALQGGLQERIRAQTAGGDGLARSPGSLNLSSSILESCFVGSSPVMQRGSGHGRGRGGARRRGRES